MQTKHEMLRQSNRLNKIVCGIQLDAYKLLGIPWNSVSPNTEAWAMHYLEKVDVVTSKKELEIG